MSNARKAAESIRGYACIITKKLSDREYLEAIESVVEDLNDLAAAKRLELESKEKF